MILTFVAIVSLVTMSMFDHLTSNLSIDVARNLLQFYLMGVAFFSSVMLWRLHVRAFNRKRVIELCSCLLLLGGVGGHMWQVDHSWYGMGSTGPAERLPGLWERART